MNVLPFAKRIIVEALLSLGLSVRETARFAGCSKITVSKYRRRLLMDGIGERCRCGRGSHHHGPCAPRRARRRAEPQAERPENANAAVRAPQSDPVAAWIAANGVTRCPTAFVAEAQAVLAPADRAALAAHQAALDAAAERERSW